MVSTETETRLHPTEASNSLIFPEDCVLTGLPQEAREAIVGLRENPNSETLKTAASVFEGISVQSDGREITHKANDRKSNNRESNGRENTKLTITQKMILLMLASSSESHPVLRSEMVRFTHGLSKYNNHSEAIDNCAAELSKLREALPVFGLKINDFRNGGTQWGDVTVHLVRLGDVESFCSDGVGDLMREETPARKTNLNGYSYIMNSLQLDEQKRKQPTLHQSVIAWEERRLRELQSDLALVILTRLCNRQLNFLAKDPLIILEDCLSDDMSLRSVSAIKAILKGAFSRDEIIKKNDELIPKLREFVVCSLAKAITEASQEQVIGSIGDGDHRILQVRLLIQHIRERNISLMKMVRAAYQYFGIPVPENYQDKKSRSSQDLGISFIPINAPLEGIAPSALSSEAKCSVC